MLLTDAIHGFYLYMIAANYSPITVKNYRTFLLCMVKQVGNVEIENLKKDNITDFLQSLRNNGKSEATVYAYWRTIRSFYNWASTELNLMRPDNITPPNFSTKPVIPFTYAEISKLIKHSGSKRNTVMILLLLDTGLRVSEAARLTINDVNLETGIVQVRAWHNGRKSKSRIVKIGYLTRKTVWSYLASRKDPIQSNAPLLATKDGKPLDRNGIAKILKRIAAVAGINCHPHKFRHTFAIEYLRNGGDIFTLQELLGHSSLVMVRHYLSLSQADIEDAHKRASPVDNWRL